jgi:hypothetical protein
MLAAPAAIPPNPKTAATMASTTNIMVHFNIIENLNECIRIFLILKHEVIRNWSVVFPLSVFRLTLSVKAFKK